MNCPCVNFLNLLISRLCLTPFLHQAVSLSYLRSLPVFTHCPREVLCSLSSCCRLEVVLFEAPEWPELDQAGTGRVLAAVQGADRYQAQDVSGHSLWLPCWAIPGVWAST